MERAQENLTVAQINYNAAVSSTNQSSSTNAQSGVLGAELALKAAQEGPSQDEIDTAQTAVRQAELAVTAEAEINAVIKEIEKSMTGEQIAAIAAMELTEDKVQTMLEEGTINFGFGRGSGRDGQQGGGAGGGFPGGSRFPGGDGPGGLGGDPGAFETRQAEMEAGGENVTALAMDRLSANMVIRLLETKTGEMPAGGFGGFGAALSAARELSGLSEEEFNAAMADGQTLSQILEANGVSIDEAKEAIKNAMADVQLPPDQAQTGSDLDTWVDQLLSGSFGGGQRPGPDAGQPAGPDGGGQSGLPDGFSD